MVVDNEFITDSGIEYVRTNARVPLMTGVARREWAHKKRRLCPCKIVVMLCPIAEFYQFFRYENVSREQVEESVRKIIETAYVSRLPSKVANSTIDLVSNATFLRYMNDMDFHYDMPGVVSRLQDVSRSS